jgi:hypothetical protein
MNIVKATRDYEEWLASHTAILNSDLRLKHQSMAEAVFPFFRATFYRWALQWPDICSQLQEAPRVLAVGDLHVENFGTWRDIEGRLIWGINDFDEAYPLPYANDLVRLAASAMLAIEEGHLKIKFKQACSQILDGYARSLSEQGRAFVLEEGHQWLRSLAVNKLRDPDRFWKKMEALPLVRDEISPSAMEALEQLMPLPGLSFRLVRRVAGLGSLGHIRVVAIADYRGAKVAREAKAIVPSAVYWASGQPGPAEILYQAIISRSVRCPDPFVQLRGHWLVRRLSPHCCRIELSSLPANRDESRLLFSMGWETANIHLGSPQSVKKIRKHLGNQKPDWLCSAATDMVGAVKKDWQLWRKSHTA